MHQINTAGMDNFPFLNAKLTEDELQSLTAKLKVESNSIHRKFATLVTNVAKAMEKTETSIESLELFFRTCGMTGLADSVKPTDKVAEVFSKVTTGNYWTFFNYELLESVVNTYCKEDELITVDLDSYITSFKSYCERRLYEVPSPSLKTDMPNSGPMLKFHIKLDKNFDVSVNDIKNIQHVISKLLDIKHLHLIDVTAGCIELTFQCFKEFMLFFQSINMKKLTLYFQDAKSNPYTVVSTS